MRPLNWLVLFVIGLLPIAGLVWTFQTDPYLAISEDSKNSWVDPLTAIIFVYVNPNCKTGPDSCPLPLWIGRYEITNQQFQRFRQSHSSRSYRNQPLDAPLQPTTYVSWEEARAFGEWLTQQHSGRYRFRLPTSKEWQQVCEAGDTNPPWKTAEQACQWASVSDEVAASSFDWTHSTHPCNDNFTVSAPVGSFPANAHNLHDLFGNLAEWTSDKAKLPNSAEQGYITHGGNWFSPPNQIFCRFQEVFFFAHL
jgi:formylglycine-generating enzyme required for sulfatase activity